MDKLDSIVNCIVDVAKPDKIILFGSHAYGDPNKDSDLDLLIIMDTNLPFNKRASEIRRSLRGIGVPLDLVVYTPSEVEKYNGNNFSFLGKINQQGKVLYG